MTNLTVTFWGTRGSYPISRKDSSLAGGNTSCVSVEADNELIIFDAGTGLIPFGESDSIKKYKSATLLLSHLHLDHIFGIPFFKPIWMSDFGINFYCGSSASIGGLEKTLKTCFTPPYFPIPWADFSAKRTYQDFLPGDRLELNTNFSAQTIALDHPGGGCGYRLGNGVKTIVYLTDTVHSDQTKDAYINFCKDADLLVYDATFTMEEFHKHSDWGHSTWIAATELAIAAGVKKLALFHHNPDHSDTDLADILVQAKAKFPETILAVDGMTVVL